MVKGDLDLYQPRPQPLVAVEETPGFDNVFEEIPTPQAPVFPKGLLLLRRFFTAYPLRPVAPHAQQQVQIPDGLDLDAWIVAPPKHVTDDGAPGEEKGKKKKKKAKGKENGHAKMQPTIVSDRQEVNEAELAAVCHLCSIAYPVLTIMQKRAERLARQRDDPYYLTDRLARPLASTTHQVDAIPIVRLDDLLPLATSEDHRYLYRKVTNDSLSVTPPRSSSRLSDVVPSSSPKVFEVDRTGENPGSRHISRSATPLLEELSRSQSANVSLPSSLQTPEIIVVKRTKKKVRWLQPDNHNDSLTRTLDCRQIQNGVPSAIAF